MKFTFTYKADIFRTLSLPTQGHMPFHLLHFFPSLIILFNFLFCFQVFYFAFGELCCCCFVFVFMLLF